VKPARQADRSYLAAFADIVSQLQLELKGVRRGALPLRMYVAGGAALHLLTGARVSEDVDATFSKRVMLPGEIRVSYRDVDGRARVLYLDRNYNDTLGLLHEDAYHDSVPIDISGIDAKVIDVRVLTPVDLAVSKLGRFSDQDRADIELLARRKLIDSTALRKRATEALQGYVGDLNSAGNSIDIACRIVDSAR
jgi:hypothetical protein